MLVHAVHGRQQHVFERAYLRRLPLLRAVLCVVHRRAPSFRVSPAHDRLSSGAVRRRDRRPAVRPFAGGDRFQYVRPHAGHAGGRLAAVHRASVPVHGDRPHQNRHRRGQPGWARCPKRPPTTRPTRRDPCALDRGAGRPVAARDRRFRCCWRATGIQETLFISAGIMSTHIRHIYQKTAWTLGAHRPGPRDGRAGRGGLRRWRMAHLHEFEGGRLQFHAAARELHLTEVDAEQVRPYEQGIGMVCFVRDRMA